MAQIDRKTIEEGLEKLAYLKLAGFVQHAIATVRCAQHCNEIVQNSYYQTYLETARQHEKLTPEHEAIIQQVKSFADLPCGRHSLRDKKRI